MVKDLTTAEFKSEVFDFENSKEWKFLGTTPTIIDFHAEWCGPCKQLASTLDEIGKEFDGKVNILKINVDTEKELAGMFGIKSIPSVLFVPLEGQPQMSMGALPKPDIVKALKEILNVE